MLMMVRGPRRSILPSSQRAGADRRRFASSVIDDVAQLGHLTSAASEPACRYVLTKCPQLALHSGVIIFQLGDPTEYFRQIGVSVEMP
jgi:hypothetical protein